MPTSKPSELFKHDPTTAPVEKIIEPSNPIKEAASIPLKFCAHGQHTRPATQFRRRAGTSKLVICFDCYAKIRAVQRAKHKAGK